MSDEASHGKVRVAGPEDCDVGPDVLVGYCWKCGRCGFRWERFEEHREPVYCPTCRGQILLEDKVTALTDAIERLIEALRGQASSHAHARGDS